MSPASFAAASLPPIQVDSPSDVLFIAAVLALFAISGLFTAVRWAMIQGTGQSVEPSPEELTNCSACGARTPLAEETCDYCGVPVSEGR